MIRDFRWKAKIFELVDIEPTIGWIWVIILGKPTFGSYSFKGAALLAGFRFILYTLYSVSKKELSVQRWLTSSCR